MRKALEHIRSGAFAREWKDEESAGYPLFHSLREQAWSHPLNEADWRFDSFWHAGLQRRSTSVMRSQESPTAATSVAGPAPASRRWVMIGLLFAAILVNYIDRGNVQTS